MRLGGPAFALAALTMLSAGRTVAGPPFLTDDPEPVDHRHWEAYLFSILDRGPDQTDVQGPAVELNCGAAPNLQLHLVVPYAWDRPQGGETRSGWGDVEVGVKLRFVQETEHRPQIGIFPMAELPAGNADRGLGNGKAWYRLPLWIQKSWGPWTTYGGGGWIVDRAPDKKNRAFGGWLAQRDVNETLTLGGEVFAEGPDAEGSRGSTVANLGGYVHLTPRMSLLFSGGRSIGGEVHTVGYLGLYWTWGPAAPAVGAMLSR